MRHRARRQTSELTPQTRAEKTAFLIERRHPDYDAVMQAEVGDLELALKGIDADSIRTMAEHCLLLADCRWEGADLVLLDDDPDAEMGLVSRSDIKAFEELLADVLALYNELKLLPPEQLEARFEAEMDASRPFSLPESTADFERWLAMPSWTPDEATALSFGRNPKYVQLRTLTDYPASPFAKSYRERLDRLERLSQLTGNVILPKKFAELARDENIDLPLELAQGVAQLSGHTHDVARRKLEDILLGMALKHYDLSLNWDGQDEKTTAIAKMVRDLADLNYGLSATDKTLRGHLKPAMKRLQGRIKRPSPSKP